MHQQAQNVFVVSSLEFCIIKKGILFTFLTTYNILSLYDVIFDDIFSSALVYTIDGNYRVIIIIFKEYGNLLLCLENYELFSLPPIFTKINIHIH